MKRFLGVSALAALMATAMAATTVVGAFGQGHAINQAGHRSQFHFEARKATHGQHVRIAGLAKFIAFSGTNTHPRSNGIYIPAVRGLGKQGNVCQFGGPAQMQVRDGNGFHLVRGHAVFNVVDRRDRHTNTGHPDLIRVRFTDLHNRTWDYSGSVQSGDIVVFERTEE